MAASTAIMHSSSSVTSNTGSAVIASSSSHSSASSTYSTSTAATDSTNEHRSSSEDEDGAECAHSNQPASHTSIADIQKDGNQAGPSITSSSLMTSDDEHEEVYEPQERSSQQSDDEDTIVTDNEEQTSRPPSPDNSHISLVNISADPLKSASAPSAQPAHAESSPSSSSLQSLSSLISLTKLSDSLSSTTGNHLPNGCSKRQSGTGKLEKIFERLAKKQNDQHLEQQLKSEASKQEQNQKLAVPESSEDSKSEHLGNDNSLNDVDCEEEDDDEDDDELDEEVDEDMMDEDEEQMKNGFRALGLLGNVAFIGDESFKCPVCGIKLDSQHTFTLHIRSHNPNDHSNTCRLCGKTLSSASSLDRHMLIHSGERPFKCSLCGMAFTTNGNMHRHMRTHGHGSIGYTPRGAKRRAKLLAQAAAKVAAAAAAGEPVDPATISKLEKSAIEVSKHPSQSLTKKRLSNGVQHSSLADAMYALPTSMEAAAAAAVAVHAATTTNNKLAAAAAKSNTPGTPEYSLPLSTSSLSFPTISPNTSHHSDNRFDSQSALNLTGRTPKSHITGWPVIHEKSKPGRKRKVKASPLPQSTSSPASSMLETQSAALLRCPICGDKVHTKMELHVHMASVHSNEKLFCLDCGMILDNYDTYIQHRCTGAAASAVMAALQQNPNADPELLFRSTNTNRMNFSSVSFPSLHHTRPPPPHPFAVASTNSILNSKLSQPLAPSGPVPSSALSPLNLFQQQQQQLLHQHQSSQKSQPHPHLSQPNGHPFHYQSSLLSSSLTRASHYPKLQQPDLINSSSKTSCGQCDRSFGSSKQLKAHQDTYCHECSTDCLNTANYAIHQFSHNIEKFPELSKVLEQAASCTGNNPFSQFNAAAAVAAAASFPANFLAKSASQLHSVPVRSSLPPKSHSQHQQQQPSPLQNCQPSHSSLSTTNSLSSKPQFPSVSFAAPTPTSTASLDLSIRTSSQSAAHLSSNTSWPLSSSMASLTSTMADMKPDLADIQSIIQMAKHAKLPLPQPPPLISASSHHSHQQANFLQASSANSGALRSPISPNRARDAGELAGVRSLMTGGDATNQPDSPASADSAAAAVAASSQSSQLGTSINGSEGSHNSKTDLNDDSHNSKRQATPSNGTNDEHFGRQSNQPSKRRRKNSMSSANSKPNGASTPSSHQNDHNSSSSSESPRFRCESCRLSFKSMNAFRRHNRGHTAGGGHSHACHLCPYKSLDKSTLIRHLRTHNGERPFQCSICKYAFTTKANCERHVRKRHRNLKSKNEIRSAMQYNRDMAATAAATKLVSEKIYIERDELPTSQDTICKQCLEDFGTNRELRAHLRVPNNPCSQQLKPFVCTICKIGFNTRNNCVRHIIKQHPATIEMTEEEAAKVVIEDESLMIETESSSSLSPSSNGHVSSRSLSGSMSSCSEQLSDGESFGSFEDEEENFKKVATDNRTQPDSHHNTELDNAAESGNGTTGHRTNPRKGDPPHSVASTTGSFAPLNLSTKPKAENVLDLSCKVKEATDELGQKQRRSDTNGLDLSVKPPNGMKQVPEQVSPLESTAASSLLALCHKSDTELLLATKLHHHQQQQRNLKDPNQMVLDSFMAKLQAAVANAPQHHHSRTKASLN